MLLKVYGGAIQRTNQHHSAGDSAHVRGQFSVDNFFDALVYPQSLVDKYNNIASEK